MYKGSLSKILFLDIETVPLQSNYHELDDTFRKLWDYKARFLTRPNPDGTIKDTPESLYERAGIYAEFGKVICISCGFVTNKRVFKIKSFYGNDEKNILTSFAEMLTKHFGSNQHRLCAHNGKEFDFPYLCRRMIINGVKIPDILDTAGRKPWETAFLDTMELWRFGDYKSFTSLQLLASVLGIPSPKDDIDGSMVWKVYWMDHDLERIVRYCQKDVITLAKIFLKLNQLEVFDDESIEISPEHSDTL